MESGWKFTNMSVAGPRHSTCEDASGACWLEKGRSVVLIAADGAGSARYAAEAAVHAVESASRTVTAALGDDPAASADPEALRACLRMIAVQARNDLEHLARERGGLSLGEFATTLLAAVCSESLLGAVQIGDGHIVTMSRDAVLDMVFRPSKGRYVNETCFVTSYGTFDELEARGEVQTAILDTNDLFGVALVSDGMEPLLPHGRSGRHPGFFHRLMHRLWQDEISVFDENVVDFLRNSETLRELSDDDKTLAIAVRTDIPNLIDAPVTARPRPAHAASAPTSAGAAGPKVVPLDGAG